MTDRTAICALACVAETASTIVSLVPTRYDFEQMITVTSMGPKP
jgi:hypothetical protein